MHGLTQMWRKVRFFLVALMMFSAMPAHAQADQVIAEVTRVKNGATVTRDGDVLPVTRTMSLHQDDKLTAGAAARLEVTFVDGTTLTLGEKASIVLDSYVYAPGGQGNNMAVSVVQGVFLFVTGEMGKQTDRDMKVTTQLATIGIRGTTFWGGPLDNPMEVLLMDGVVEVRTPGGSVILDDKGEGTSIKAPGLKPLPTMSWPKEKRLRAFATVAF